MPHFLINSNNVCGEILKVDCPETLRHLACALRVQKGEVVKFIDENKVQYETEIIEISKKEIKARILSFEVSKRELEYQIFLAQSVLKTDAQNLLISNAAQLGIKGVYPFVSDHCAVKKEGIKFKNDKWQKVADEAFKQCERADLMPVFEISPLKKILEKFKPENIIIFAEKYENSGVLEAVKTADINGDILVVVGPEGGFSEEEFEFFKKEGYKMVTLGNLIFKAPNAVTAGVSKVITVLDLYKEGFLS